MRFRNVVVALIAAGVVAIAAPASAREIREPRAQFALDVPDSWSVDQDGDYIRTHPHDRTFSLRLKGFEHGGWQEREAEARMRTYLVEHLTDITYDQTVRRIDRRGFEGHEIFGKGIGRDGVRRKFFALALREKANPRKGVVALGIGTHEGYELHNRGIYEALNTLRAYRPMQEIREPRSHVILDVPGSWIVDQEGEYARAFPEDRTFRLSVKGISHGGWQEREAEEKVRVYLLEHLRDMEIDTRARRVDYNGFHGHEMMGRGTGRDGVRRKFFAIALRNKADPRKGVVVLGLGTHEGYELHHRGIYEAIRTLRTY